MKFEEIIKAINTKPYYQDDSTVIYCADNREILPQIPDKSVDLVLTDPPYGIDIMHAGGRSIKNGWRWRDYNDECEWDLTRPDKKVFDLMRDKSNDSIIWGGNYYTDYLPPSKQWLIWDKGQRDFSLADGELAWSSKDNAVRIFNYSRASCLKENGLHPTQKPLALMKWCISLMGGVQVILDPFMGSGTTLVATKSLGIKSIGIDISKEYCDVAIQRLSQTVMQLDIQQDKNAVNQTLMEL